MRKHLPLVLLCSVLVASCTQGGLSAREALLEQLRLKADAKRRDLQVVAGEYDGTSEQTTGAVHDVHLSLQIKDVPTPIEGTSEDFPMPALRGSLKFLVGAGPGEFFSYVIEKDAYDPLLQKVELLCVHPEHKELLITLVKKEGQLIGTWTAPSLSANGTLTMTRAEPEGNQP